MNFGQLRRSSPLPILFTVRTTRQGGSFPDPYTDNPELMSDYLALLELGLYVYFWLLNFRLSS